MTIEELEQDVINARLAKARELGIKCAVEAINAAGPDPTDCEGESMLPTEPQQGDYEYAADILSGGLTEDEEDVFIQAYQETIGRQA